MDAAIPVIVGAGLAGMLAALELAPMPCRLVTRGLLGTEGSSGWAQGGIAAAVGGNDDPELHAADTVAAGDGLCDAAAVDAVVRAGPAVVAVLERHGVRFDRDADGAFALGLEAAHSRHRIVHAGGDGTGAAIVRALAAAVRATPSVRVMERTALREILRDGTDGPVCGVVVESGNGRIVLPAAAVMLATGGLGGLFRDTTNPLGAMGAGLAVAARAGAVLGEMEFVQFHPTALAAENIVSDASMALVSEAVRGEGAVLVDERGERFTDELRPRDVVSRAVWRHLAAGHAVFLDARGALGARFGTRFPGIDGLCRARGVDPATMPIPVRPAAHYHMGGIVVDADARSTVPGLWAAGECACTGLHGANRLASNSLLEAAVGAMAAARAIAGTIGGAKAAGGMGRLSSKPGPARADAAAAVRTVMTRAAGVERTGPELERAIAALLSEAAGNDAALTGLMLCVSAHRRRESRGGHFRADHPERDVVAQRGTITAADAVGTARELTEDRRLAS
ncbi:MAG: L-aspartate oxidase [Gluconacetobacter diazotrophicus]|nr:L-aspartate oxidase [Gluconacetobacter diazotrophicus]